MRRWQLGKTLCLAGLMLAVGLTGCSSQNGGDSYNIYTEKSMSHFKSEKKAISDISSVDISCSYADIEVIASDGFYLEYSFYYVTEEPELTIDDGTLFFDDSNMNQGSYSISQKDKNYIKLYVPTIVRFESFSLSTSSGDISAGTFAADKMKIINNYGDVVFTNAFVKDGTIKLSSGSLKIEDVGAENLELENSYGDITLLNLNQGQHASTADHTSLNASMSSGTLSATDLLFNEIQFLNAYGDVTLSVVTADTVEGTLKSGELLANDIAADHINMNNSYGDVTLVVNGQEKDYNLDIHSAYGAVAVGSEKYEGNVKADYGAKKDIELTVSSGDISLNFK